jgi:hypothetical protein
MEHLAGPLSLIAILAFFALMIKWTGQGKYAEMQMRFETQKQIIDKIGPGPEMLRFIESKEGREFFEHLKVSPPVFPRRPGRGAVAGIGLGLTAIGLGLGLLVANHLFSDPNLLVLGCAATGAGIGMTIGAAIAYRFSRKEVSIQKETAERPA